MTVASFPIHSYLPLDLMETDYSLIRKPLLTAPLEYSKLTWSFVSMSPQEKALACYIPFDKSLKLIQRTVSVAQSVC